MELPQPPQEAVELSQQLVHRIRGQMAAAGGSLPFDRYMDMALYEPGLGYYSAGLAKIGPAGDFTTAPEVSSLFSRTLALQCSEILAETGGEILELGAGTGRMAADLLAELARHQALPGRYYILEVSAHLRQVQRETLEQRVPELLDRVEWLERLPEQPIDGVILANEVLDALPVKRFKVGEQGLQEYHVTDDGAEGFDWRLVPASQALEEAVRALEADLDAPLAAAYSSELCLRLSDWVRAISDSLARGVVLFVDYGYPRREYYHPQRHMGTLVCHYRHRGHGDPLILPGLQDITAFVDFTAVALAGRATRLEVLGYTTQAHFLMGAGLPGLMEAALAEAEPEQYLRLSQQAKHLMLPGEMGERFKVLALGRDYEAPLAGFSMYDQQASLGIGEA